jgi:hypothetical protein
MNDTTLHGGGHAPTVHNLRQPDNPGALEFTAGGIFMAIRNVVMDRRDSADYRNHLKRGGFLSASYLSISGFDANRLKKLAQQGKLDAIRCAIGKSIRWYYSEKQAELAHLRGLA